MTARVVVVVHGIGEQRQNETVQAVIHRFAELRAGRPFDCPLTLGALRAQSESSPWIELAGIPAAAPAHPVREVFVGRPSPTPGADLRFADLHWAGLLQREFPGVGEPVAEWGAALIARLKSTKSSGRHVEWICEILRNLLGMLGPLQMLANVKIPGFSRMIFDDFLGDAQLYGDSPVLRGRAIRLFHRRMADIHERHVQSGTDYKVTVIGHSLGSVLSFDSLLFARAGPSTLAALPGYPSKKGDPSLAWIPNVDSFVTLGSPIDKYLMMWWLNYEHLARTDWIAAPTLPRIRHYNYCDEQDPVGHRLDMAGTAAAVQAVFDKVEDRVFYRYPIPGAAHVRYWQDRALFHRILDLTVDGKPLQDAARVNWFNPVAFLLSQVWAYALVTTFAWLAAVVVAVLVVLSDDVKTRALGLVAFAVTAFVGLSAIRLIVKWRQALVCLRNRKRDVRGVAANARANLARLREDGQRCRVIFGWVTKAILIVSAPAWIAAMAWLWWNGINEPLLHLRDVLHCPARAWPPILFVVLGLAALFGGFTSGVFWWTKIRWARLETDRDYGTFIATDPSRPAAGARGSGPVPPRPSAPPEASTRPSPLAGDP